jgi:hypothetical protein
MCASVHLVRVCAKAHFFANASKPARGRVTARVTHASADAGNKSAVLENSAAKRLCARAISS